MSTIRERNGKWQAIVRVKDAGKIIHSEVKTFATERLARDWAAQVEKALEKGVTARLKSMTNFSDLIDKYRTARMEVKPLGRAMLGDLDMLSRHLGGKALEALTSESWVAFARARRAGGAGPATVMHNLAIARTVLRSAKPMFGISTDSTGLDEAVASLKVTGHVAKSQSRDRRVSDAEIAALIEEFKRIAAHPYTIIRMADVVQLAVLFPRRAGELCDMRWADYKGGIMVLRDTKHPRVVRTETVPVPPLAQTVLAGVPVVDERILPYKSESVSAAFDRACTRIGIEDLHFHDLRHEGICRLFESGLQIQEVAMVSGHMSWTVLKRYTHLRPQDVLEKMDAHSQVRERRTEPARAKAGH